MQSRRPTTVILFGGLPGSGKSTVARQLVKAFGGQAIHLEYDVLEDSIVVAQETEEQRREAWNVARRDAVRQLENLCRKNNAKTTDDRSPRLILMDDNFHLRGMRKQIHRMLLNYKPVNFGIIWMQTPVKTCLERNRHRERQIPVRVFEKMNETIEPPRASWESSFIQVLDDTPFEAVLSFVRSCPEIVDTPETRVSIEQQESDRRVTAQNQSHNWDKLVRGWVGTVAKYDKTLAPEANDARKAVLKLAKEKCDQCTGDVLLTSFVDHVVANDSARSRSDLLKILNC